MALEWWNFDDTVKLAPDGPGFTINADGGIATALQEFHLWNNKGGVGAATEQGLDIEFLARLVSTNPFTPEDHEILELAFIEARLKGNTAWEPMTPAKLLTIPDVENDSYEAVEVRISAIVDVDDAYWEILVRVHKRGYKALGSGFFESVGNGVISGLGNRSKLSLLEFDGVEEDPGGASDDVNITDLLGNLFGELDFIPEGLVNVGLDDFSAATPIAGEAFYFAVVYGSSGVEIIKADLAATPLTDANKPVIPDDKLLLAWGTQDDTGTIENSKIENVWHLDRLQVTYAGTTITIHHGDSIINNNIVYHHRTTNFNLTDNDENYLFQNRDQSFELNVTGIPEQESAMLIWEFTVAAGAIVGLPRDKRKYIGVQHEVIQFTSRSTPVAVSNSSYISYSQNREAFIRKVVANVIGGSGAGDTVFDIESSDDGSTFTTIFTDQTKRPSIAGGDNIDIDAKPQVRKIMPNTVLRVVVDSVSGTPPDEYIIALILEIP